MDILLVIIKIVIALGIYNVWIVRPQKTTPYRGADAHTMKEEFLAYGLPRWFVPVIGTIKIVLASALVASIWIPVLSQPAAGMMGLLMLGAMSMHAKIKDPILKALPSAGILGMLAVLFLGS